MAAPQSPSKSRHARAIGITRAVVLTLATLACAHWHLAIAGPPVTPHSVGPAHPPWIFGRPGTRFTVVEYADLECPYCRAYFPVLERWIAGHPEVNWEWHNFPLSMHEPAASLEALWVECAGETRGNAAFWRAVAWIYQHTRGEGEGLPSDESLPGGTPAFDACVQGRKPEARVRAEVAAATQAQITATPTLRLIDHRTGRSLILLGPVEGDALLSAIDLLAAERRPVPTAAP